MTEQENEGYPREPKTDKQGRIIDPFNGRALRDHRHRNYGNAPFMGRPGKPHPRKKHLDARIKGWEEGRTKTGRKKPGSLTK